MLDKEKEGENERKACICFFPRQDWCILQAIVTIATGIRHVWLAGKNRDFADCCVEKKKGLSHISEGWCLAFEMHLACGLHQLQAETATFHLINCL